MYRYRFTINKKAVDEDPRPCIWPINNPYWLSGENDTHFVLVAYEESPAEILRLWPEAENIETLGEYEAPVFSSRFPCPMWYREARMEKLREKYIIFTPEWSWGSAHVLVRKDGQAFCHVNIYKDEPIPSITDVFVQPDDRKKGIGDELLRDAEELARLMNFTAAFLWTNPEGWCRDWYYRHGYREYPNRPLTPQGEILMEKDFSNYKTVKI